MQPHAFACDSTRLPDAAADDRFAVHVFPADHGDCLWIEYGPRGAPRHLLIDAGTQRTAQRVAEFVRSRHGGACALELLVVTHVDADHIGGVLPLLSDPTLSLSVGDVWFNGYRHLLPADVQSMGPLDGERLTTRLADPQRPLPWNAAFGRAAVRLDDAGAPPPAVELSGGMRVQVLSADARQLARMEPVWLDACRDACLDPQMEVEAPEELPGFERMGGLDPAEVEAIAAREFREDRAPANGSSIGLALEYRGKRALLLADALPSVVMKGLRAMAPAGAAERFAFDLVKVSHHGSRNNTSLPLVRALDCREWVFSTNGRIFKHPDDEAVARVVTQARDARLWFNYRTARTEPWDDDALRAHFGYRTVYGDGTAPLSIELL